MSGIAGILHLDGAAARPDEIAPALAALAHRGSGAGRSWCHGPVALACAQRRVTPQSSREVLPFEDTKLRQAVVHDARLDNREDLWRALCADARPFAETSDAELLLAAWRRWGVHCPEKLLGDFTFAIWDGDRRELFVARDHAGVRVLYWHTGPGIVVFASEIKALLALPGVPRRLDRARLSGFMAGFAADRAATFYAGVARLLAGESLLAAEGGVRRRLYHQFSLPERVHAGGVEEVAAGFRDVFTAAVRDRLVADPPAASMLSGGLDSSLIVAAARSLRPGLAPFRTYSYVFSRSTVCDETRFIREVVDQGGVDPVYVDADTVSPLGDIDALLASVGEPFEGAHLPYRRAIGRLAAQQGVAVLLEGSCGDPVTSSGFFFLAELARHGRLVRLAREIRGLAREQGIAPRVALRRFVLEPNTPAFVRAAKRKLVRRTARFQAPHFLSREAAEATDVDSAFESFWHSRPPATGELQHHLHDLLEHLPGSTFELTYAAEGIEPRYPFLDRRVIEYCLAVPPSHRISNGLPRMIARRAFADSLPVAVAARRSKANPSASLTYLMFKADGAIVGEALARPDNAPECRWLDMPALREAYRRGAEWSRHNPRAQPSAPVWLEADQVRKAVTVIRWLAAAGLHE